MVSGFGQLVHYLKVSQLIPKCQDATVSIPTPWNVHELNLNGGWTRGEHLAYA